MAKSKLTDDEINDLYLKMLKRKKWKSFDCKDNSAWFGGKNHWPIAEYLPEGTLDKHNFEDLDFLVVGWRKA